MIAGSGAATSIGTDSTGIAQVTIAPVPAAPSCVGYGVNTLPGGSTISVALTCTMPMGLPVTYSIAEPPAHGTLGAVSEATGIVDYTPGRGFSGTDIFTFNAQNSGGASAAATVTITVPPAPPAPAHSARCVVPKVKGKSLAAARRLLFAAHCALGRVTRPRPRKHKHAPKNLVVIAQGTAPGTQLAAGSKVPLTLGTATRSKRQHGHR
jgi:hypothetical protein